MTRRNQGLRAIFGLPVGLALLSLVGLVGALLEDGTWDLIGAGLLATVILVIAWARLRPGQARRGRRA